MAVSRDTLARRIRDALEQSGMPQRTLAEYIEMDETALSRALSGQRNFRSLEVARIAERLNLRTDALFADDESRYWQTAAVAGRVQEGEADDGAVAEAVRLATELAELDQLLADVGYPAPSVASPPLLRGSDDVKQGDSLAGDVLTRVGGAALPPGVEDLARWLEDNLGFDVCITPLPVGVDGLALTGGALRLVAVSSNISATRQRFTMAHEVGHVMAGDAGTLTVDEDVFGVHNEQERRANAFAAAFLVPAQALRDAVGGRAIDLDLVVDLLGHFRVSLDMLAFRLHNVGIVIASDRDHIRKMTSARIAVRPGRSNDLQARNERRAPNGLLDRALAAFAVGRLGIRPLAHLLRADPQQLLEELTPPRFAPHAGSDVAYAL